MYQMTGASTATYNSAIVKIISKYCTKLYEKVASKNSDLDFNLGVVESALAAVVVPGSRENDAHS